MAPHVRFVIEQSLRDVTHDTDRNAQELVTPLTKTVQRACR
jgi:hypothetical protein